jgi:hypothetical protein
MAKYATNVAERALPVGFTGKDYRTRAAEDYQAALARYANEDEAAAAVASRYLVSVATLRSWLPA